LETVTSDTISVVGFDPAGEEIGPIESGTETAAQPAEQPRPVVCIPPTGIALEEIERQALIQALQMCNWVQKDAAELLCISPRVMNHKIGTHGLTEDVKNGRRAAAAHRHPSR
jgi:DNA-binding NtrC family response regulator